MVPSIEKARTWPELKARLFCDNMRRATVVIFPQLIVLWLAYGSVPGWWLVALLVSIVAFHAARLLVIRTGEKSSASDEHWSLLVRKVSLVTVLHGIWIGLTMFLLAPNIPLQSAVIISVVVIGIQAGSVATITVHPPTFATFSLPIFLGFALAWYKIGPAFFWVMAPLYGLLLMVLRAAVTSSHAVVRSSFELRVQRNEALALAESANQEKARFLATASHDLRQPATALALMSNELSQRDLPDDLKILANNIQRSSDSVSDLLDKLFDLAQLDSHIINNTPFWYRIEDLTTSLNASLLPKAQARGLDFSIETIPGYLWVDRAHIQRLLSNVLDNAIKYTDSGKVTLAIKHESNRVVLEVTDTGRGIAPEQLEKVWSEQFRADQTDDHQTSSLGLGLSIVLRLAALLKAKPEIESQPGQGTRVRITFAGDLYTEDVAKAERVTDIGPVENADQMTVLLVEDSPEVREAMTQHLGLLGFTVQAKHNEATASEYLTSGQPIDLLITDYRLEENGLGTNLIAQIKKSDQRIPALLMSAQSVDSTIIDGTESFEYLQKPIQTNSLRDALERMVDKRMSSRKTMPGNHP